MAPRRKFQDLAAGLRAQRRVIVAYLRRRAGESPDRREALLDAASELERELDLADPAELYRTLLEEKTDGPAR